MQFSSDKALSSLWIASASAVAVGLYWYKEVRNKRKHCEIPERWTAIGKVSTLLVYPLKSGYYKELNQASCKLRGMEERKNSKNILRDRAFILYDKDKRKFITAKCYEKIVLIETKVVDDTHVEFSVRDGAQQPLLVNIDNVRLKANINSFHMHFNEVVKAFDCGDKASDWFSMFLLKSIDRNIRLGMYCEYKRTITNSWDMYTKVYDLLSNEDIGRFSDIASFMILNEESVNDLNTRIPTNDGTFTCHHFRPNIVVKNCIPYEEDSWDWLKIGDAIFRVVKPCTRCIAVSFNPETGIKNPNLEPIRTLRTYRRLANIDERAKNLEGQSPVMGVYAGLYKSGNIELDDIVFVATQNQ